MNNPNTAPMTYLRQSQIIPGVIPISASTLWRWVRAGTFPKPIKLSARCTVWPASEVNAWVSNHREVA